MSLTVETGAGLTNADSYQATADVDSYNTLYVGSAAWLAGSSTEKDLWARRATQYLDLNWGTSWLGYKNLQTQALDWPRTGVYDRAGRSVSSAALPIALKKAHSELSIRAASEELMPDVAADDSAAIVEEDLKVGPLQDRVKYSGGKSNFNQYTRVQAIISELIGSLNSIERG